MVGPGIFTLPLALKQAGLWAGFFLIFFFGAMTCYCMDSLVKCAQYLSVKYSTPPLDYGEMAYLAFKHSYPCVRKVAPAARLTVNTFLILLQLGICSVYYVFVVQFSSELWLSLFSCASPPWLGAVIAVPFLILSLLRHIRTIAVVSMLGMVFMFIVLLIVLVHLFSSSSRWSMSLPAYTSVEGAAMAAGSILYMYEGQAMVLPLEKSLRHRSEMRGGTGLLSTGMALTTIEFAACAFYGYISYGDATKGSITLNMPNTPVYIAAKIILILVVYFGYPIMFFVIVEMLWPLISRTLPYPSPRLFTCELRFLLEVVFRLAVSGLGIALGALIPSLDRIIPLVGVSCGMVLALVFPPILHSATFVRRARKGGPFRLLLLLLPDSACALVGFFFLVYGMRSNILALES